MIKDFFKGIIMVTFHCIFTEERSSDGLVLKHQHTHYDMNNYCDEKAVNGQISKVFLQFQLSLVEEKDHVFLRDICE